MVTGLERRDDLWWPSNDVVCWQSIKPGLSDLAVALAHVQGRDVAVQAGGNCGVWPGKLAEMFETVYTVEPDSLNYEALIRNVPENVVHQCASLGAKPGYTGLSRVPGNAGATHIKGGSTVRVVTIDGLGLDACDFICLDVEGYELAALKGAVETLRRFRPVIQFESNGLIGRYGATEADLIGWLESFGYGVVARVHKDVIVK